MGLDKKGPTAIWQWCIESIAGLCRINKPMDVVPGFEPSRKMDTPIHSVNFINFTYQNKHLTHIDYLIKIKVFSYELKFILGGLTSALPINYQLDK